MPVPADIVTQRNIVEVFSLSALLSPQRTRQEAFLLPLTTVFANTFDLQSLFIATKASVCFLYFVFSWQWIIPLARRLVPPHPRLSSASSSSCDCISLFDPQYSLAPFHSRDASRYQSATTCYQRRYPDIRYGASCNPQVWIPYSNEKI